MEKNWVIADTYFFDNKKAIELGFKNFKQLNAEIIENWNLMIAPNDVVLVMGIFSRGLIIDIKQLVSKLHGKKILLRSDSVYSDSTWKEIGFDFVIKDSDFFVELSNRQKIIFSCTSHDFNNEEYLKENQIKFFCRNNCKEFKNQKIVGKNLNLSNSLWDYKPTLINELDNIYEILSGGKTNEEEVE